MKQKTNLLDLTPRRLVAEAGRVDGKAYFSFPRYRSAPGRFFGRLLGVSPAIKVTLDEKSTAVWDLVDGRRTATEIGVELHGIYGAAIESVYERLAELLQIMQRNGFIYLETIPNK